jgi:hypothetical protein
LRQESGAYHVKQKLGFELKRNNFVVVSSGNPIARKLANGWQDNEKETWVFHKKNF